MEYWDLYDCNGSYLGMKIARGEKIPENSFHRIVHIWIYNERDEFLIQKRAAHLKWFPNRWATTTGSVLSGEFDYIETAYREVEEELGLGGDKIDIEYVTELIIGHSIVSLYKAFIPHFMKQFIRLNDEVSEVQWMKKTKIETLRKEDSFAAYNDATFDIVYKMI